MPAMRPLLQQLYQPKSMQSRRVLGTFWCGQCRRVHLGFFMHSFSPVGNNFKLLKCRRTCAKPRKVEPKRQDVAVEMLQLSLP